MAPVVVRLRDVWASLGGNTVLENINLDIVQGRFVGIIGPNGAGKTTLLKVMMGLLRPDRGEVRLFGRPPERLGPAKHWIGYVPQRSDFNRWFPLSVLDVVMMGRCACRGLLRRFRREDREAAEASLKRVGLWDLRHRPIGELSGGQQQRVFLARSLCGHTRLLLLDEPNTGLDLPSQARFHDLLVQLQEELKLTVVVVSHDLAVLAHYADELVCINRTLHVHGTPQHVLTSTQLQEAYQCEVDWWLTSRTLGGGLGTWPSPLPHPPEEAATKEAPGRG